VRAMVKATSTPNRKVVMDASAASTPRSTWTDPSDRETAAAATPVTTAGHRTTSPWKRERAIRLHVRSTARTYPSDCGVERPDVRTGSVERPRSE